MDTIRIGIVGAGANTIAKHIPLLQAIEDVSIVSVCNRSRASSERVAQQFNIPTVYEHWEDLVAAHDTDAIVIGTWPYMHCRITLAALAAGKHVLCEARMAMDLKEALQMRDAARARPLLVAQIVPSPLTLGVDATIKRLISEGYLGEVLAVRIRDGNSFIDRDAPMHWRQNKDYSGYNVMSMGIWYEALMRWIGEASSVLAQAQIFVKTRRDSEGQLQAIQVPDHIDIIAQMACGAQAHLQFSAVTGLAGGSEAMLFGSEGTLRFADGKLYGARKGQSQLEEIEIPEHERGEWRVEQEFIDAIRGQGDVKLTDFETGVKYMRFTEAVARSVACGSRVSLDF
jgi:predicted dehydrogenase